MSSEGHRKLSADDTFLNGIANDITIMKSDISGLKTDVCQLKSDVSEIKSQIKNINKNFVEMTRAMKAISEGKDITFNVEVSKNF